MVGAGCVKREKGGRLEEKGMGLRTSNPANPQNSQDHKSSAVWIYASFYVCEGLCVMQDVEYYVTMTIFEMWKSCVKRSGSRRTGQIQLGASSFRRGSHWNS